MADDKTPSRRHFIRDAAAIGTGAAVAAVGISADATPTPPPRKWDNSADVIIIGGGGGGLVAASMLAHDHVSVILLEKEPTTGGSSAICGGAIALAGTDMQKAAGINDSNDLLISDLLEVGQHVNNVSLVKAYAANQADLYPWLKGIGAKFINVTAAAGQSVPRSHNVDPGEHLKLLRKVATDAGAKILDMTPAQRLVYDDKAGRVVGVIAKDRSNRDVSFHASKAVIIACGGYGRDKDLLALFTPPMKNAAAITGLGNTGDGLRMAWALGAGLADVAYVKATYGFKPESSVIADMNSAYYKGAIMVNQEGLRFVNESISYKLLGDASAIQTGGYSYQVYDETVRQASLKDDQGLIRLENMSGTIVKANSLEELAGQIGIKPEVLRATADKYNGDIAAGADSQFGRKALSANYGKPTEIKTAPFYAMKSIGVILGTYSGVTINDKAEVVDVYGNIIPGLFAVGEVTGGFHGGAYMTGTAFGKTLVFGMIAAKSITAKV